MTEACQNFIHSNLLRGENQGQLTGNLRKSIQAALPAIKMFEQDARRIFPLTLFFGISGIWGRFLAAALNAVEGKNLPSLRAYP
jgi:hypothetical protein